jgi:hypothetical protein
MTPFSFGVYIVNLSMDLTYSAGNPSLLIRTLHHIAVDDAVLPSEEQIMRVIIRKCQGQKKDGEKKFFGFLSLLTALMRDWPFTLMQIQMQVFTQLKNLLFIIF